MLNSKCHTCMTNLIKRAGMMVKELEIRLKELKRLAIAFSGGIDSAFLLFMANKVLGKDNVLAVIVNGQMISESDYNEAIDYLEENDFNYKVLKYNCLEVLQFRENHKDRCYYCKKCMMSMIKQAASENGFEYVADGKNADDTGVYRPGNRAAEELGIINILEQTGFTKHDIRNESKKLGIKMWNKPSNSCLATRFPYNTVLTDESLKKAEFAEEFIKSLGIQKVRVRVHGDTARIEVESRDFDILLENNQITEDIKKLGFKYVTLDLSGIKSGSFD